MGNRKRGAMKMKLSTIAKTSLALGILTTGVMTTHAQSVDATGFNSDGVYLTPKSTQELINYYKKSSFDHHNLSGHRIDNKVEFLDETIHQPIDVRLTGSDKDRFKNDSDLTNVDVFVVREDSSRQVNNQSIGGITKPNSQEYTDYVKKVPFSIERNKNGLKTTQDLQQYQIKKEEVSLKELDFKLRKELIDKHGLYSYGNNAGKIVIKMKDRDLANDYYTFDLSKKLEEERMGDVVDTKYIDRIDVEYK